jgi:thiol-disulfide isomerase/thioredoxin
MGSVSGLVSLLYLATISLFSAGDTAPSLEGVQWIRGKAPVFSNQVTVVELWRPSCGNCKAQIPHLTSLQKQYGDKLTIAAISKEPLEAIEDFIKTNGDQMDFTVGKASVEIADLYMAGISGVPYAYIINKDGLIVWKGHPASMDEILASTIEGKVNIAQLKNIALLENSLDEALKTNNPETIMPIDQKLLLADPSNEKGLEVGMSVAKYKHNPALVKEMYDRVPQAGISGEKANLFAALLIAENDLSYRYPEAALKFSFHAITKEPKNDTYIDLYARVLYTLGDIDRAILYEKKALAISPSTTSYQSNLNYYLTVKTIKEKIDYNSMTQLPDVKAAK